MANLEEVKNVLRSLLISTKDTLTVQQLDRDFNDFEGQPIPYRAFAFNNLFAFLKSLTDVLRVHGSGLSATVTPIIDEKVAGVASLVARQISKSKKSRKKLGRLPPQNSRRPSRVTNVATNLQASFVPKKGPSTPKQSNSKTNSNCKQSQPQKRKSQSSFKSPSNCGNNTSIRNLGEMKLLLQCLLVSTKETMTVEKLDQDFKKFEGQSTPYQAFGYKDLVAFLKSLTDVLRVHGSGLSATVTPIITEKVAEVAKLVATNLTKTNQKQKSSSKKQPSILSQNIRQPRHSNFGSNPKFGPNSNFRPNQNFGPNSNFRRNQNFGPNSDFGPHRNFGPNRNFGCNQNFWPNSNQHCWPNSNSWPNENCWPNSNFWPNSNVGPNSNTWPNSSNFRPNSSVGFFSGNFRPNSNFGRNPNFQVPQQQWPIHVGQQLNQLINNLRSPQFSNANCRIPPLLSLEFNFGRYCSLLF